MLSDITIARALPIISGYVQCPNDFENGRNNHTEAEISPAIGQTVALSAGSGRSTGAGFGAQRFYRLPAIPIGCCGVPTEINEVIANLAAPVIERDFPQ